MSKLVDLTHAFVGVIDIKQQPEVLKMKISIGKLQYLITECLELHPFMPIIEHLIIKEFNKDTVKL